MVSDSDIKVWLDMVERVQPAVIVPYVQSEHAETVRYRVRVQQEGSGGKTVIGQAGAVQLLAGIPAPLSRLSMTRDPDAVCDIEITLTRNYMKEENYRFKCPPS